MAGQAGSGVRAAETVLQVLETVAFSREDLGVTQIAQRVGLTKSAVFRHLQSLVERGYFVQDAATARYRLGPRARLLASRAPAGGDLAAAADGPMRDLRDRTGFSVVLSTPTATSAFVFATLPGTAMIEIGVRQGSELALHASAQGKILLAFGAGIAGKLAFRQPRSPHGEVAAQRPSRTTRDPERWGADAGKRYRSLALRDASSADADEAPQDEGAGKRRREQQSMEPLPRFTQQTITDPDAFAREIEQVRARGFAVAPGEAVLGINALAVPVFDGKDALVAALALVGSQQHLPGEPDPALVADLAAAARAIGRQLG